jgi:hypothetical protein
MGDRGWELVVDTGGSVYYRNNATGESSWDPPEGFTLASAAVAGGSAPEGVREPKTPSPRGVTMRTGAGWTTGTGSPLNTDALMKAPPKVCVHMLMRVCTAHAPAGVRGTDSVGTGRGMWVCVLCVLGAKNCFWLRSPLPKRGADGVRAGAWPCCGTRVFVAHCDTVHICVVLRGSRMCVFMCV